MMMKKKGAILINLLFFSSSGDFAEFYKKKFQFEN